MVPRTMPSFSLTRLHHQSMISCRPTPLWRNPCNQNPWSHHPQILFVVGPSSVRLRSPGDASLFSETAVYSNNITSSVADASIATVSMEGTDSCRLVSSIGVHPEPPASIKTWKLPDPHLLVLSAIACMTGAAVTALFVAAVPTLLAFKKAAESLEKLLDITREELPGTMAAVRLSGMEISDLTLELSELGQEITEGVRSSARAVRAAEDGLRRMSNIASIDFLQERATVPVKAVKPAVALAARNLRERLVQARNIFHSITAARHLVGWITGYYNKRKKWLPRAAAQHSLKAPHAEKH